MKDYCTNCFSETKNKAEVCPICGYEQGTNTPGVALSPGYLLNDKYIIGQKLGAGGFGITYLAMDARLHIKYAIKEYFPTQLCERNLATKEVTPYKGESQKNFDFGKRSFLQEAKTAAKFNDLETTVTIYDYFESNQTAYIVMEYLQGQTLQSYLKEQPRGKISWTDALDLVKPIMEALRTIHESRIIHRDISPDNIFITKDNHVKLLDFGAARQAIGEKSQLLSMVLKQGYAPPEQYSEKIPQGAYTDVYALCATLYRCVTGVVPPDAVERMMLDEMDFARLKKETSDKVYQAMVKGLSIDYQARHADVDALTDALLFDDTKTARRHRNKTKKSSIPLIVGGALLAGLVLGAVFVNSYRKTDAPEAEYSQSVTAEEQPVKLNIYDAGNRVEADIQNEQLANLVKNQLFLGTIYLEDLPSVESLTITDVDGIYLGDIAQFENLKYIVYPYEMVTSIGTSGYEELIKPVGVNIYNVVRIDGQGDYDLSFIYALPNTNAIEITHCNQRVLDDVTQFYVGKGLKMLSIVGTDADLDLSGLRNLSQLESIRLEEIDGLTEISFVFGLKNLTYIDIDGCENITSIAPLVGLNNLHSLEIHGNKTIENLEILENLNLEVLKIYDFDALRDVSQISTLTQLKNLELVGCKSIESLGQEPLSILLEDAVISHDIGLTDITALQTCNALETLDVSGCDALADISCLSRLSSLQRLDMQGCTRILRLEAIQNLSDLTYLNLFGCEDILDLDALETLDNLFVEGVN